MTSSLETYLVEHQGPYEPLRVHSPDVGKEGAWLSLDTTIHLPRSREFHVSSLKEGETFQGKGETPQEQR